MPTSQALWRVQICVNIHHLFAGAPGFRLYALAFLRPFDRSFTRPRCGQGPGFRQPRWLDFPRLGLSGRRSWTGQVPHLWLPRQAVLSRKPTRAPSAAGRTGREKHKYSVPRLGSGKFPNPSGKVSLSPFTFFFPQQEKTSFGTLPMQMCEDSCSHVSGTEHFLLTGKHTAPASSHSRGRGPAWGRQGAGRGASAPPGSRSRHCGALGGPLGL